MTTDERPPDDRSPRRGVSRIGTFFIAGIAVFCLLAALPWLATVVVVALWGMGGSGSNK